MPESIFYSEYSGYVARVTGSGGEAWSTIHGGAGTNVSAGSANKPLAEITANLDGDKWAQILRCGYVWDTSDLPDTCTLNSAVIQAVADAYGDDFSAIHALHACSFTPASGRGWVAGDYDDFLSSSWGSFSVPGSLPFTVEITLSTLTAISKTGDTIIGIRDRADLQNLEPSIPIGGATRYVRMKTGSDAKLRVTYTPPTQTATPSIVTAASGLLTPTLASVFTVLPAAIALPSTLPAATLKWLNKLYPGVIPSSAFTREPLLISSTGPRTPLSVEASAAILQPLLSWWNEKDIIAAQAGMFVPTVLYDPWPFVYPNPVAAVAGAPSPTVQGINVPFIAAPAYNLPTVLYLTSNDTGSTQTFYVRQRGDRPIDITEATSVVFKAYDIDGNIVLSKPGTVGDAVNGIVNFSFLWTDFPGEGLYLLKLVLQFGSPAAERSFPSHDSFCYLILNDSFHG